MARCLTARTCCFLLSTKKWINSLSSMPQSCGHHGVAMCRDILYVIYGESRFSIGQIHVCSFDPKKNKWNPHDVGKGVWKNFSVTTYNEELYVIGGDSGFYQQVKVYNPALGTWKGRAPMNVGRAGHCAVVLQKNIYVMAGHDGKVCYKSVERYNPATNQWQKVPSLSNARRSAAGAVSNGKIIVVGGFSAMEPSKAVEASCEVFDPCTNEWSLVTSPVIPRAACGTVSIDDIIYLFGGQHEEHFMNTVESFDLKHNEWRDVATMPIDYQGSFHQASLVRLPKDFVS